MEFIPGRHSPSPASRAISLSRMAWKEGQARALMLKRSSSAAQCNAGVLRTVRAGMRATAAWRAARRTALCARSMPTVVSLGGNTRTCSS